MERLKWARSCCEAFRSLFWPWSILMRSLNQLFPRSYSFAKIEPIFKPLSLSHSCSRRKWGKVRSTLVNWDKFRISFLSFFAIFFRGVWGGEKKRVHSRERKNSASKLGKWARLQFRKFFFRSPLPRCKLGSLNLARVESLQTKIDFISLLQGPKKKPYI